VSSSRSSHRVLTCISRAYKCTLIVFSKDIDPLRSLGMVEEEEKSREYFEETKDILQLFYPYGWMEEFQKRIEDFIQERLIEAAALMAVSIEEHSLRLHGLRRLIAGAVQEGELVRQPRYAMTCARLDKAIIWDGRRYVITADGLFYHLTFTQN
jgi:hypothetical protein